MSDPLWDLHASVGSKVNSDINFRFVGFGDWSWLNHTTGIDNVNFFMKGQKDCLYGKYSVHGPLAGQCTNHVPMYNNPEFKMAMIEDTVRFGLKPRDTTQWSCLLSQIVSCHYLHSVGRGSRSGLLKITAQGELHRTLQLGSYTFSWELVQIHCLHHLTL